MLSTWMHGPLDPNADILGIPVFVIGRIAKTIQLLSGLVIVVELVGEEEVDKASSTLLVRLERYTIKNLLADLQERFRMGLDFFFSKHEHVTELSMTLAYILVAVAWFLFSISSDSPVKSLGTLVVGLVGPVLGLLLVVSVPPLLALLGVLAVLPFHALITAVAFLSTKLLRWERATRLALWISLIFLMVGFGLELMVS
jgi:hypothetical protein